MTSFQPTDSPIEDRWINQTSQIKQYYCLSAQENPECDIVRVEKLLETYKKGMQVALWTY